MAVKIPPTVGRVVLFHDGRLSVELAATIAAVNEDGTINIGYLSQRGVQLSALNVTLVQDGEPKPETAYAEWMPYQKGQAAKAEAK